MKASEKSSLLQKIDFLLSAIKKSDAKDKSLARRIMRLEEKVTPKKVSKKRVSKYVPKIKGKHTRIEIENRIDEKYSKKKAA